MSFLFFPAFICILIGFHGQLVMYLLCCVTLKSVK